MIQEEETRLQLETLANRTIELCVSSSVESTLITFPVQQGMVAENEQKSFTGIIYSIWRTCSENPSSLAIKKS